MPLATISRMIGRTLAANASASRQRGAGALRNRLALVLGDCRQDVDGQLVGMRLIDRDKLDLAVHQRGDERNVAREAVKLGDDQLGLVPAAGGDRPLQLGPLCALAALDLGKLLRRRPRFSKR
jgi:hypothetical protein